MRMRPVVCLAAIVLAGCVDIPTSPTRSKVATGPQLRKFPSGPGGHRRASCDRGQQLALHARLSDVLKQTHWRCA
jgi:hypothetical protein